MKPPVYAYAPWPAIDPGCSATLRLRSLFPGESPTESVQRVVVVFSEDKAGMLDGCIDLNAIKGHTHKDLGVASAVQAEADRLKLSERDLPGLSDLLAAIAENNRTGYLKKSEKRFPFSFATLLRQAEEMPIDGLTTREERATYWLRRFVPVVDSYFAFRAKSKKALKSELDSFRKCFPDIAEESLLDRVDLDAPEAPLVCLPAHLLARFSVMETSDWEKGGVEALEADYRFWREAFKAADKTEADAKDEAARILKDLQTFATPVGPAAYAHTDNRLVAKYLWLKGGLPRDVVILLTRSSSGHGVIQTRAGAPIEISQIHQALVEREPGKWTRDKGSIQNGTGLYVDVEPSALSLEEKQGIIRAKVLRAKKLVGNSQTLYDDIGIARRRP